MSMSMSKSAKRDSNKTGIIAKINAAFGVSSVAARNKSLQSDFISEMRLLARLRHPCIISVMGAVVEKVHSIPIP